MNCPFCGGKINKRYEIHADEAFTAYNPFQGLVVWGPYSAEKEIICEKNGVVHFRIGEEHRLVKMLGNPDYIQHDENFKEQHDGDSRVGCQYDCMYCEYSDNCDDLPF